MGQPVAGNKTGTTLISISTSSLDMLIGTFMVQTRETHWQTYLVLGNYDSYYLATQATQPRQNMDKKVKHSGQLYKMQHLFASSLINLNILLEFRNGTLATLKQCRWGIALFDSITFDSGSTRN
jgi:hypothetical protein